MIKFFRRIRQNLLAENKFSKYLVYALGEIILVVIGILIAVSINNSNQKRIEKEKEQAYLIGLKREFQISKNKLAKLIEVNKHSYEGAKKIMGYIGHETALPTERQFSDLLYNSFAFDVAFNPNNSLLNEMISSGGLKGISNTELRIHLTNWISTLEDISKQEIDLGKQRERILDIFRANKHSIKTILDNTGVSAELALPGNKYNVSNLELLNSLTFENNMLIFILTGYATEQAHYNPLMNDIDIILGLIETEINE
ncbi:hypothetical protein K8352_01355 [Flavobacteriaceae bacterium F89]|uniref:Uncharacterized protein n=1 Tax=Cerina litoralis TaxID=2874477 RepID=A0AAE3JN15_9FLAO|nr:DUF6090 family protein [Cerina litoralis]MCG2459389.1 hypothetical protein [Cerina litoralis]